MGIECFSSGTCDIEYSVQGQRRGGLREPLMWHPALRVASTSKQPFFLLLKIRYLGNYLYQ